MAVAILPQNTPHRFRQIVALWHRASRKQVMEVIDLIDEELARIVEIFKLKDESELLSLQANPIKKEYKIFRKRYPLIIFSELDSDGTLNVIAEITNRHLLGSETVLSKGFKLKNGVVTNLTEQELWEFD